jgi:hypothetical protein
MDSEDLHEPLLAVEDQRGRALSVSVLAPHRASSSSLHSEASTPRPPTSVRAPSSVRLHEDVQETEHEGQDEEDVTAAAAAAASVPGSSEDGVGAGAPRGAGLRFAPMPLRPAGGGPSRNSSISSASGGKGGMRTGSFSRDTGGVLHRSASHKVGTCASAWP